MQSAKDTFYIMLRDRIAAINSGRTVVVRGVARPGVVAIENELPTFSMTPDIYLLRWTEMSVDAADAAALVRMQCDISYATDGMGGNGGMDRGRLLGKMDAELAAALSGAPQSMLKTSYSAQGAVTMLTNVFWGDPTFAKSVADGERVSRVATVDVFAYQEVGEL